VLLVRVPNWLGDLVMSMEALSGLSRSPGGMGFWAHGRVSGLLPVVFPGIPVIDSRSLPRRGDYSRLLLLTDSFRSAWMGFRSGIPERIGHAGQMRDLLLSRRIAPPAGRGHHHSLDFERLAREAGSEPAPVEIPGLEPGSPPHIAVFPGAAFGPAKRWYGFAEAARIVSSRTGLPAVFYGSAGEAPLLSEIRSASGGGARTAAGLTYPLLCAALAGSRIAIGNDSGGMHLAALLGVPSVVVFGSTSPEWTAPSGRSVTTVRAAGYACSPCFRKRCPEGGAPPCLGSITVEAVANAASAMLGTGP